MSFTTRMIDRANKLLIKYGRTMTLKRTVAGVYNPATGTTGTETVTTYSCYGLVTFITRTSANQFYGTSTLQNTMIQKDDEMCYLSAKNLSIVPQFPTDRLVVGSSEYNIMFVTPLKSGSSDVLYVLQIRK